VSWAKRPVVDGGAEEAREADGLRLRFDGFERAPEDLRPHVDAEGGLKGGPARGGVGRAGEAGDHLAVPGRLVGVLEREVDPEVGVGRGVVGGARRVPAMGERQEREVPGEPHREELDRLGGRAAVEFGLPQPVAREAGPSGTDMTSRAR
jgi:hypothetical protein